MWFQRGNKSFDGRNKVESHPPRNEKSHEETRNHGQLTHGTIRDARQFRKNNSWQPLPTSATIEGGSTKIGGREMALRKRGDDWRYIRLCWYFLGVDHVCGFSGRDIVKVVEPKGTGVITKASG